MKHADLIERLQSSNAPNRELDGDIAELFDNPPSVGTGVFDWQRKRDGSWQQDQFNQPAPPKIWHANEYTSSVDACIALLKIRLPGYRRRLMEHGPGTDCPEFQVLIYPPRDAEGVRSNAWHNRECYAMLIAILQADSATPNPKG